jgi:hypothetical protein
MPLQIRQGVRRNALPLLLSLELLLATGYMAWMHSRGNSVLGHYSYACFLMPFVFLVFGSSFWAVAESMSQREYVALCGVSLAVLAASWYKPEGHAFLVAPWVQLLAAIMAVSLLILALLLRQHVLGSVPAMTGFVIFSVLGLNQSAAIGAHTNRPTFDRLVGMWDRINAVRNGREIRFWYNVDDSDWLTNFALSALFLNFVTLSEHFPAGCEIPVNPNTLVIVSSRNQGITSKARSALTDCWRNAGMHPVLELTETLAGPYTLSVFRAEPDSAKWLSLQAVFDRTGAGELVPLASGAPPAPFPSDRWVVDAYPVDRAVLTPVAAGLHVRAPKAPFGFAVGYVPLRAPITGWYYFVLKLRDTSGWFAFGARPGDDSTYLAADRFGHPVGDHREMSLWVNLKKGDMVRLRTANNDLIGFGPARFVMEQLTASVVPAP